MKKVLLLAAFVFAGLTVNAQEIKLGVNAALPSGDAGDITSFGALVDIAYLFEVGDTFQVGPSAGVYHFFGKSEDFTAFGITTTVDFEDVTFIPIGAAAQFDVSDVFFLGANLGYGIGVSPDGNDGGFYYRPKAGYSISEAVGIVLSYSGVSVENGSFDSINLGVEFGF